MWLLTTDGFYSAVLWTKPDEHHGKMCVRSREKKPLVALRRRDKKGFTEVAVSPTGDYRYRVWCSRETWGKVCAQIAQGVDYDNFKSAVLKKQGASRYEKALHTVWTVLSRIQPAGPYGHGGSGYPPVPRGEPKPEPWSSTASGSSGRVVLGDPPALVNPKACVYCGDSADTRPTLREGEYVCRDLAACLLRDPVPA